MTNLENRAEAPDYETDRQQLITAGDGTEVIPWAVPEAAEFAGVKGNVAWNAERQEG